MKHKVFKFPNAIIRNQGNLHPSTIAVAMTFYANMGARRRFANSIQNIAAMSGRCKDTVRQAVDALEAASYIEKKKNFTFSATLNRNIYARTSYRVTCPVEEDYTLVPYSWLNLNLTPCALQVLLCCRMFMLKERDRAFPSIRKIAAVACIAKSTVCAALNQIKLIGALIIQVCQKVDGAFACNSYHIVKQVVQKAVTTLQMEGWVPQIQLSAKYEISGINPLSIL